MRLKPIRNSDRKKPLIFDGDEQPKKKTKTAEELKLFDQAMGHSKRALAQMLINATQQLTDWTECAMSVAAYLYVIEPHAELFSGGTFAPDTLTRITDRALPSLKDAPYARVIYIIDNEDPTLKTALPVDVVDLTDREQWGGLIENLNNDRDTQHKIERGETEIPIDCTKCMFKGSCNESTTKTGILIYQCAQRADIKQVRHADPVPKSPPQPRTLEHHPDDPARQGDK